ncbi:related to ankyrin 3 [Rhynchosporium agropyri]|uniref:Related to ankyrin 3 n=1 Tax=Rhynchosporium agropyri TaxID=914238 RepID=A0A1E1LMA1_9HELO|nr:related to ankyrin 3 [Rhynchosporium agropyri]
MPQNGITQNQQQQHYSQAQVPWSKRSSSIHGAQDTPINNGRITYNSEYRSDSINVYDQYGRNSAPDAARSVTNFTEPDSFHEDLAILELDPAKVVRHSLDPSTMPRVYARNGAEGDTANMKGALVSATRGKNHKLLEQLLHRGVSPNLGFNMHPLKEAVFSHDEESLRLLLLIGADPNESTRDSITPLFTCVERSFLAGATMLLKYGADPNLVAGSEMESALAIAAIANVVAFSHLFLTYNGNANYVTANGSPLLTSAIKKRTFKKFIDMILAYGAKPNAKIREGHTALFDAINLAGVSPDVKKEGIYTPLCTSICDDRAEMFKLLLANKADPNLPASEYPAFKCVTHDRVHFLAPLVVAGAKLDSPKGIIEEADANPNGRSSKGHSALTTAIRENRPDFVDLLIMRGADAHVRGEDWPLVLAVAEPLILKRLLTVMKELQAFKGIMARAVHADQLVSLKMLLAAGVSVEDKNGGVFSPLTTFIREDHRPIVKYLLTEAGGDVNSPGEHLPVVKSLRTYRGI